MNEYWLLPAGLIAGFIDSIAGGGGIITVPSLVLVLGHGPHSVGTNKLSAGLGVAVSFLVYLRAGHFRARNALPFALTVGVSSLLGSFITPLVPLKVFPWLLLVTCPLVLLVVWNKSLWLLKQHTNGENRRPWIYIAGVFMGLYDGLWGPGGGTFMFLALVFLAKLPIMESLAASKLANLFSATMSFSGFAFQGYVHFSEGLILSLGMITGSLFGARLANKNAEKIVRPALTLVVILLLTRVLWDLYKDGL